MSKFGVVVGSFMIKPIIRIDFTDLTELIPAFLTIVLIIFTYNIGVGMTSGIITYVFLKVCTGRVGEIKSGLWVLALLSILLFVFL
ncbi:MAG TPA: hypothetical protein VII77_00365, partial [Candidatus Deferrimicrobium sp.]